MSTYQKLKVAPYMGAKQKLLERYIENMLGVPHKVYVETCIGMGNLCLNYPTQAERVINDSDIKNALLFKALAADSEVTSRFLGNLSGVEYDENTYNKAYELYRKADIKNKHLEDFSGDALADIGAALYILFKMSYCGIIKGCFLKPEDYNRVTGFKKHLYDLPAVIERMHGTKVLNMDAVELIAQYSENEDALIVSDPPYLPDDTTEATADRSKKADDCYEETIDYNKLIPVLKQSKSKIMLCNYNNKLLRTELVGNGWKQIAIGERTIDAGKKKDQKHRDRSMEYIYINY